MTFALCVIGGIGLGIAIAVIAFRRALMGVIMRGLGW
jgi:hypothetical protein